MKAQETKSRKGRRATRCEAMADFPLWTALIAPVVALGVGGIAATVAGLTIRANREIARNRATFDYLDRTESTTFYQEITRTFVALQKIPDGFKNIYDPQSECGKRQRLHVIQYLNHYENISLAIQWGTLAEEIYYRAFRSAVVDDWETAKQFIEHRRTASIPGRPANPTAFVEFEWLARRWALTEPKPGRMERRRNWRSIRHLRRVSERAQLDDLRRCLDVEREERRSLTTILTSQRAKQELPPVIKTPATSSGSTSTGRAPATTPGSTCIAESPISIRSDDTRQVASGPDASTTRASSG